MLSLSEMSTQAGVNANIKIYSASMKLNDDVKRSFYKSFENEFEAS